MAVGREPNIQTLNLSNTDVKLNKFNMIITDEFENTTAKGIYSVGDCNGKVALTPVAIKAGRIVAERIFNGRTDLKMNYDNIPSVIFSHPPIGSVGLSEEKAVEKYGKDNIKIYKTVFKNMYDSFVQGDNMKVRTFFKMITLLTQDEKVIGFHGVGHGIDEMVQTVGVAMTAGATKRHFDETVAIHPTASEELVLMDPKLY